MSAVANYLICVATPAEICNRYAIAVAEIANSIYFDIESILDSPWSFSQAICLLWQDRNTGDLDGRKSCEALQAGLAAALILDLAAHRRVVVACKERQLLGVKWDKPVLSIADKRPTGSYLDSAMFNKLLDRAKRKSDNQWPLEDLLSTCFDGNVAKDVLQSLVDQGTLSVVKGLVGRKRFPTVNPEPQDRLQALLRIALVDRGDADPFMRCMIALLHLVDNHLFQSRLVKPHFSQDEYPRVKLALEALAQQTRLTCRRDSVGDDVPLIYRDASQRNCACDDEED